LNQQVSLVRHERWGSTQDSSFFFSDEFQLWWFFNEEKSYGFNSDCESRLGASNKGMHSSRQKPFGMSDLIQKRRLNWPCELSIIA